MFRFRREIRVISDHISVTPVRDERGGTAG